MNLIVDFTEGGKFELKVLSRDLPAMPCPKEFIEILLDHIGNENIGEDRDGNLIVWSKFDKFRFTYHGIESSPNVLVLKEHKKEMLDNIIGLYKEILNSDPPIEMGKYDLFKFSDEKFILRMSDRPTVMSDEPLLKYLRWDLLESIENNDVYLIYNDGSFMVRSTVTNKMIQVSDDQINTIMTFSTHNMVRNDLREDFKSKVDNFFRYADV